MDDFRSPRSKFGAKKPYGDRKFGPKKSYDNQGYKGKKSSFDRPDRPYQPRGEKSDRPYRARTEGDRPARAYSPREGGERKPYAPRGDRPYTPRPPREGGQGGEGRPYRARTEGDRPARAYSPHEGGERKPYAPRGDRPYRAREANEGSARRSDSYREGGQSYGEGRPARFSGKRETKRPRNFAREAEQNLPRRSPQGAGGHVLVVQTQEDGWLIGHHAVYAALASGRRKVRNIWLMAEAKGPLAELIAKHPEWQVETKTRPEFEAQFGEAVHQGVAALVGNLSQPSLPELLAQKPRLLVALDQVTDPHNLGAIVRSCAAFGAEGVIVTEHRAAGLSATAAKVAAGAMETIPVVEVTNLVQALNMLKEANFTTIGLAGEATQSIYDTTQNLATRPPLCLVVGSEGDGLRRLTRETCDTLVQIPISPTVESLNVSVATGVALSILTNKI